MRAGEHLRATVRSLPHWIRVPLQRLRARIFDVHARKSYSQEGEDLLLGRFFEGQARGFYVDVGAHHPSRFSNTLMFYRRGWHGINIEPNPQVMRQFRTQRARDINLQCGVGDEPGTMKLYQFDDPALNTFDADVVASRLAHTPYKLVGTIEVPVERLQDILLRHLPHNQVIDFLSIDVEGYDLRVLRSNDWQHYRPRYVLVEARDVSLETALRSDTHGFMTQQGYELLAKTFNTLLFRELLASR